MDSNDSNTNTSLAEFNAALEKEILSVQEKELAIDILDAGFSSLFVLIGLVGNIFSIIVFYKMGYKDTINISMTFICSVELTRCLLMVIFILHYPFRLISPAFSLTWYGIGRVTFSFIANTIGTNISGVLAAYVSIERCLCVSVPFSVKFLLTPRVVWTTNILLVVIVLVVVMVYYSSYTLLWVFNSELNTTIAVPGLTSLYFKHPELDVYMGAVGIALVIVPFSLICVCTVVISYHLHRSSKFKALATHQEGKRSGVSGRDRQIIKMLLLIIVLYIVSNIHAVVMFLSRALLPEFTLGGKEHNLFEVWLAFGNALDHFNATANIFIFYFMSTQFKETFKTMVSLSGTKKAKAIKPYL